MGNNPVENGILVVKRLSLSSDPVLSRAQSLEIFNGFGSDISKSTP